jgi:probable addiction module antidote protein
MRRKNTTIFDPVEYIKSDEDIEAYLEAALETNDAKFIASALGNIAKAKGMTAVAKEAGIGRESLYKALSPEGNPEFATILKVVNALGLHLHATRA